MHFIKHFFLSIVLIFSGFFLAACDGGEADYSFEQVLELQKLANVEDLIQGTVDFITQESWHSIKNIKNCQFFFATHSPTIASSFDPWEIIELKFNKTGKVEQKLYYEGERNVNNFTIYPKYLDIDSILMRVFDVSDDIYINREEKIDEFADYNIKIRKMEQKDLQNRPEYQELIIKRNELGKKLDWRT